jgi:hypothetical protein
MPRRALCVVITALLVAGALAVAPVTGRDEPPALLPPVPGRGPSPSSGVATASLHEGFESERATWRQEETDIEVNLQAHDRTDRARHDGQRSEHFRFTSAGNGSLMLYSLPLGRIPLTEDLTAGLWVRSNRPGVQLSGRIVLPADTDPDTGQATFVTVPGGSYDAVDSWQRLKLADIRLSVERQARVLRQASKRKVGLEGAYLDRLIVNLYGGPGESEVFLDDLTLSPVPDAAVLPGPLEPGANAEPDTPKAKPAGARTRVVLAGGRLGKDGQEWIPSILWAPRADLEQAYAFGFDALAVDFADKATAAKAVKLGFLLMPMLGNLRGDPSEVVKAASTYPFKDSVAFWHLGSALGALPDPELRKEELERIRGIVLGLRDLPDDFPKLTTGDIAEQSRQYATPGQGLDLMGVAPEFWSVNREVSDAFQYLMQRRNLTALWNLRAPYWAWIDTVARPVLRRSVWGTDQPPAWGEPRLQPEQVRIATFLTLMAGYRGVGFRSDDRLTTDEGRSCLYEMALVNAELDLVQGILAKGIEPIANLSGYPPDPKPILVYNANMSMGSIGQKTQQNQSFPETREHPSIKAAAIPTEDGRGRLILIADAAGGAQWQPPQAALNDLKVTVPGVPENAVAWEVTLGGVRNLEIDRPPGGRRFSVPEFGLATMVVLTTDAALVDRLRTAVNRIRPRACDLAIKEAKRQLTWVHEINALLVRDDHKAKDADDLLADAKKFLDDAEESLAREEYQAAYDSARRVGRPLRILMRDHWEKARDVLGAQVKFNEEQEIERARKLREARLPVSRRSDEARDDKPKDGPKPPRQLVAPVASPALMTFNTLPQHYLWTDWVGNGTFGRNLLPSGGFDVEGPEGLVEAGWVDAGYRYDKIQSLVLLEPRGAEMRRSAKKKDAKPVRTPPEVSGKILHLSVRPQDPQGIDTLQPVLEHAAAAVRSPAVRVRATELVRIRVMVLLPRGMPWGTGGVIVRDSLGGETLQFRQTNGIKDWHEVCLLRRVPEDGELTVTLGLAGYGDAYFDNLRIERLVKQGTKKKKDERRDDADMARSQPTERTFPNPYSRTRR